MSKNDRYVNNYLTKPYKPNILAHLECPWNSTPECVGILFLYNLLSINHYEVYIRCVFSSKYFSSLLEWLRKHAKSPNIVKYSTFLAFFCDRPLKVPTVVFGGYLTKKIRDLSFLSPHFVSSDLQMRTSPSKSSF